jgi:hypothetical protein
VGNQLINNDASASLPFWYFDAVTNSGLQGSDPGGYVGKEGVDGYYNHESIRKADSFRGDYRYIPAVSPGYNDRSARPEQNNPVLSRRLTADSEEGSLFYYQLKQAKKLVDPAVNNMILVNRYVFPPPSSCSSSEGPYVV